MFLLSYSWLSGGTTKKTVRLSSIRFLISLSCAGSGTPWLVEGKMRYVELSLRGSKHVTQLHVGQCLAAAPR